MSLLDILRAAVPAAAVARGGYLTGEQIAEDRARKQEEQRVARERQSYLDQIRAAREQAEANEATARADALRHPAPKAIPAPAMRQSGNRMMQWDGEKGMWVPSDMAPPAHRPRASEDPAAIAARERKEGRVRTNQALQATHGQLKDLTPALANAEADVADAEEHHNPELPQLTSRLDQIRSHVDGLRRDADSLTAAIKSPENAARYDATQQRFVPLTSGEDVSAPRSTPTRGGSVLRGGGAASGQSSRVAPSVPSRAPVNTQDVADAEEAWRRIKSSQGKITLQQALNSSALTDGTKAELKRLAGVP